LICFCSLESQLRFFFFFIVPLRSRPGDTILSMSHTDGKYRLLSPLSIRFSQPRVAPLFQDGRQLEESRREIQFETLTGATDAREDVPYDSVLVTPFPIIRVVPWLPKLRNTSGEPVTDRFGDQLYGERAWFALDNRRLYALQSLAAGLWPMRCCVVVRCLEEVPGWTCRELRKFRTTTEGLSVEVGCRAGQTRVWRWQDVCPQGAFEDVVTEGLSAEELHDAAKWAPMVMSRITQQEAVRHRRRTKAHLTESSSTTIEPPSDERAPTVATDSSNSDVPKQTPRRRPELLRVPDDGWQYIDLDGNVQGPFCLEKMRLWSELRYFFPHLQMRCSEEDEFVPFSELFPKPMEPFKSCVVRRRAVQ